MTSGLLIGRYDPAYPLFIDPTLTWHTFLGSSDYDKGLTIAVDGSGNVYVAGYSSATWGRRSMLLPEAMMPLPPNWTAAGRVCGTPSWDHRVVITVVPSLWTGVGMCMWLVRVLQPGGRRSMAMPEALMPLPPN